MNFFLLLVVLLIGQFAFSQNKDVTALMGLNQAWLDCYPTRDTTTLGRILADDFRLISPSGAKMSKMDVMKNVAKSDPVSIKIDSVDVRLLTTDVAIITAYASIATNPSGKANPARNCYQDVYMKREGKWMAVAAHVTGFACK